MALNVPAALRSQIDQEHAVYSAHIDAILAGVALMETDEPADRTTLIVTALYHGLTGTPDERTRKALSLAGIAIERLSRKAKSDA